MKFTVIDIEANGLLDKQWDKKKKVWKDLADKVWVMSYSIYDYSTDTVLKIGTLTDLTEIFNFLQEQEIIVGHNIIEYDLPLIEKLSGKKLKLKRIMDTILFSWNLFPVSKFKHGLENWGERLGFPKVKIAENEWAGPLPKESFSQFISKMKLRCGGDVEINVRLLKFCLDYYELLYNKNWDKINSFINFLHFKADCFVEHREGIPLNVPLVKESLENLTYIMNEKVMALSSVMPEDIGKVVKEAPKTIYKKDKSLSVYGAAWFDLLRRLGLPENTKVIRDKPNPLSHTQLKTFLFRLGWAPETFKPSSSEGKPDVPQISLPFGGGLCPSILKLKEKYVFLEYLVDIYMVRHRIGIFNGYLENLREDGRVVAKMGGLSTSLRIRHRKPISNLPKPSKFYGKEVRGALYVDKEDEIMIGFDISGLESGTADHFIYEYDRAYVEEKRKPGYDPHLAFAVIAEMVTQEESDFYKSIDSEAPIGTYDKSTLDRFSIIDKKRSTTKTGGFALQYGAYPPKIAESLGCSLPFAQKLFDAYWVLNIGIKKTADNALVHKFWPKIFDGRKIKSFSQNWIYNPVNGFWYFLKKDKDRFSVLSQSLGAYFFDCFVKNIRILFKSYNIKLRMQIHDESMTIVKKSQVDLVKHLLNKAMDITNKEVGLNVTLSYSLAVGNNYSDVH